MAGRGMIRGALAVLVLAAAGGGWWFAGRAPVAAPALAEDMPAVPSGQAVTPLDVIRDAAGPAGLTLRFRFVAPAIAREGGTVDAEAALSDMQALCDGYVLPRLAEEPEAPAQVIVTLADRPTEFGQPAPEATQYFEAFRPDPAGCVWEVY